MDSQLHFRSLEKMYSHAPVNNFIISSGIHVSEGYCKIVWHVDSRFFHAGKSLHGAFYFKLLDDAAYFAAASLHATHFLLTKSFKIDFYKPVTIGVLFAEGKCTFHSDKSTTSQATLYNEKEQLVSKGEGIFIMSNLPLLEVAEYAG